MSAHKYGTDPFAYWERDAHSLPAYQLAPAALPRSMPPLRHVFGTGRIIATADQHGVVQVTTVQARAACSLHACAPHFASAISLQLTHDKTTRSLFVCEPATDEAPLMTWGVGYVVYAADVCLGDAHRIHVELELAAPFGQPFLAVAVRLTNLGEAALSLQAAVNADVAPAPPDCFSAAPSVFLKSGVAVLTDVHETLGDYFLVGADSWQAGGTPRQLRLASAIEVAPQATEQRHLLLGYSPDCTVDWVKEQLNEHTCAAAREAWAARLAESKVKGPELWMQEECLWDAGRLLAFAYTDAGSAQTGVTPGGTDLFAPCSRPDARGRPASTRDLLALALPLGDWDLPAAAAVLRVVAASQSAGGRLPERLGEPAPHDLDSASQRSDLEVWLLLAWCELLSAGLEEAELDAMCPFVDAEPASVWEHLCRAYHWLRDELGVGPHGLLRMLAGDWNGALDRVGVGGRGESVLTTAMACYAFQRLSTLARRREQDAFADNVDEWTQALRVAVGEAFDGNWFRRAYTDSGRALGADVEDRVFVAVQAWAVLARCGTAAQRELALDAVLARRADPDAAIACVSRPFPLPPPDTVSSVALLPGHRENAGVVPPVTAWFVWALACEGRKQQAMHEWERMTIRFRAARATDVPAALLMNLGTVCSTHAGQRSGLWASGTSADEACLPSAHAVAWQDFALRKILS